LSWLLFIVVVIIIKTFCGAAASMWWRAVAGALARRAERQRVRTNKMLAAVVAVFAVTWTPFHLHSVIAEFRHDLLNKTRMPVVAALSGRVLTSAGVKGDFGSLEQHVRRKPMVAFDLFADPCKNQNKTRMAIIAASPYRTCRSQCASRPISDTSYSAFADHCTRL